MKKLKILLVNDDGIMAPSLHALVNSLKEVAEVTVVAPATQMSGMSGAITMYGVIRRKDVYIDGEFFGYSITGTPADCVYIALHDIMPQKPDYVFSGINPGANLSTNSYYSGTVAGATEGLLAGITACAVSQDVAGFTTDCDFSPAATIARVWLEIMEKGDVPKGVLYNINVPNVPLSKMNGFAFTRLDTQAVPLSYERRVSPRGETYYWWSDGDIAGGARAVDSDSEMLKRLYVSVTPMTGVDRTDYDMLEQLRRKGEMNL